MKKLTLNELYNAISKMECGETQVFHLKDPIGDCLADSIENMLACDGIHVSIYVSDHTVVVSRK